MALKSVACNYYPKYKGRFQPRCKCLSCWFKYFRTNQITYNAAYLTFIERGIAGVKGEYGDLFAEAWWKFYNEETK
jgi:hypothetical protein